MYIYIVWLESLDTNDIGYIKLTMISRNTSKDFKKALVAMNENNMIEIFGK